MNPADLVSVDWRIWFAFLLLWLHQLGHVRAQKASRCACGLERTSVPADSQVDVKAGHRLYVCRGCGALYARKVWS